MTVKLQGNKIDRSGGIRTFLKERRTIERVLNEFIIPDLKVRACHLDAEFEYTSPRQEIGTLYLPLTGSFCLALEGAKPQFVPQGGLGCIPMGHAHRLAINANGGPQGLNPLTLLRLKDPKAAEAFNTERTPSDSVWILALATSHAAEQLPQFVPDILTMNEDMVSRIPALGEICALLKRPDLIANAENNYIAARLASIVAMSLLMHTVSEKAEGTTLFEGFYDERIRRAIRAFRSTPEKKWTLDSLAGEAGLSRSAFVKRFKRAVGETPLAFVSNFRMDLAATYLLNHSWAIGVVAERVGYGSEASFTKAFRRRFDIPPSEYRNRKR